MQNSELQKLNQNALCSFEKKKKKSKYLEVFPGRALKYIIKQKKEEAQTHAARVWAALIRTAELEKMK